MKLSDAIVLDPRTIRDIRAEVLDESSGRMRVLPAAYWETTTIEERGLFGNRCGIYSFPTLELVERLRELIAGRSAIEIGAGNGVLAEALGIPGTDSFQQQMPRYRQYYEMNNLAPVPYGPMVAEMHASRAVRYYQPDVVIGCWVTHKFDPRRPDRKGNEVGIDEPDILRNCALYIMVGHEYAHQLKPIWERKHTIEYPSYVYSRAMQPGRNFIACWEGSKKSTPITKETP